MFTQIVRVGDSLRLIVTEEMLAALDLSEGDFIDWVVAADGQISLIPSQQQEHFAIRNPKCG